MDLFRERVTEESRYILQIFPEYTPHDSEHHLDHLFYLADKIIGKKQYDRLNATELFLLCLGLYGHDWGMAVSNSQKDQLISEIKSNNALNPIDGLLHDEKSRFLNFLHEEGISVAEFDDNSENGHLLWQKYVRVTHAERSGERIQHFFSTINVGIADAADKICMGHSVNFEMLDDNSSYPIRTSVLGDIVNLQALTLYCRLIDLFDLGSDRTPYTIWKYVAPENPQSKLEWDKHRALREITCQEMNQQRRIVVEGKTSDPEVYAALTDLKNYCDLQLRLTNDLFARMHSPDYGLDIYYIDWEVRAEGFEPISVQFEFERNSMFEILSDEIYHGDCYVFLRELLQNSIDAIKMRKKLWDDKKFHERI